MTASRPSQSRIFILHNVLTVKEAEHIKSLGVIKGMEKALIIPYGQKNLVESTTRTNTAAWLEFGQDPIVRKLEVSLVWAKVHSLLRNFRPLTPHLFSLAGIAGGCHWDHARARRELAGTSLREHADVCGAPRLL